MLKKTSILLISACIASPVHALTNEQKLGKLLYSDVNLSLNRNQSCASCHSLRPANASNKITHLVPGFVDPDNVQTGSAVSDGSISGATGTLNAPSVGYAAFSPEFNWDEDANQYVGGQFWNGRATNLTEQAKGPFLNPVEMAMPSKASVIKRLTENQDYHDLFLRAYGLDLGTIPRKRDPSYQAKIDKIYHHLAKAIGEFERINLFNKFNSKFDFYLDGRIQLSELEKEGLALFNGKAKCSACHTSDRTTDATGNSQPPLFTDFTYDNLGLPRNVNIPNNSEPDLGLGGRPDIQAEDPSGREIGRHKVMSLRNIELTAPYGHNGVFATLEQIVHFYNTRDTLGTVDDNSDSGFGVSGWPSPEVPQNVNRTELGDLGLTDYEEKAIVSFMKTLTDDYPIWGGDPWCPANTPSSFSGYQASY